MKKKVVGIRMSDKEFELVSQKAKVANLNVSSYIRDVIIKNKTTLKVVDERDKLLKLKELSLISLAYSNTNHSNNAILQSNHRK